MKLLLCAVLTTSLIELLRRPWFAAAAIICGGAIDTASRPRSLARNTGKLGCFQLSAVHTLGLYELNTTDRTAVPLLLFDPCCVRA